MNPGSIRLRLALWYLAVLGAGMALLAVSIFLGVRYELLEGVDESLTARLHSFGQFLELESQGTGIGALAEEAREYSTGLPDGHHLRVRTADGTSIFSLSKATGTDADLRWISQRVSVRGHDLTVDLGASLDHVYETLAVLRNTLLLSVPLVLAVAIAGGTLIAKRALAPVDAMTADAQAIGMQDLSRRLVVPPTGDELERLGVAWNTMLDRLADSLQRTKRFTADAAHELRTPIAIIRSTAELALRKERDASFYCNALSGIQQETVHLSALVEDLMFLARYDAALPPAHMEDIPVEHAVRDACLAVAPLAEARGVGIDIQIAEAGWIIRGNPLELRRLMLILLDNALKFTPPSEHVRVVVTSRSGRPRIEFHDRGEGISEEHLNNIFDRFYRADASRTTPGVGLGLAIAKAIVDANQGVIGVASTSRLGSCFYVELPGSLAEISPGISA